MFLSAQDDILPERTLNVNSGFWEFTISSQLIRSVNTTCIKSLRQRAVEKDIKSPHCNDVVQISIPGYSHKSKRNLEMCALSLSRNLTLQNNNIKKWCYVQNRNDSMICQNMFTRSTWIFHYKLCYSLRTEEARHFNSNMFKRRRCDMLKEVQGNVPHFVCGGFWLWNVWGTKCSIQLLLFSVI